MSTLLHVDSELVGVAWVKAALGWSGNVGTELPGDQSSWAELGFVQMSVVGGSESPDLSFGAPVFAVDCWAVVPNSRRPPWNMASQLCTLIKKAAFDAHVSPLLVTPPGGYASAAVRSAVAQTVPIRMLDDPSSFARKRFHLQMWWTEVIPS